MAEDDALTSASAAVRVKESYLRAQFLRLKAQRAPRKAILAVAASMLTAAYYMLHDALEYRDLGPHYRDRRDRTKTINRLLRRLSELGGDVAVVKAALMPTHARPTCAREAL